jgi:hypothetical protein
VRGRGREEERERGREGERERGREGERERANSQISFQTQCSQAITMLDLGFHLGMGLGWTQV